MRIRADQRTQLGKSRTVYALGKMAVFAKAKILGAQPVFQLHFTVNTVPSSRDSALIDAGLTADLNGRVSLFLDYLLQAGQDNYFGQSVEAGVKIGF